VTDYVGGEIGSPGPDRVVFTPSDGFCDYAGAVSSWPLYMYLPVVKASLIRMSSPKITHTGASNNAFVSCT
jgi:hypothetical protein